MAKLGRRAGVEQSRGWTSPAFLPDDAEVGRQIRLVLTYTDGRGTLETVISNTTTAVVNVNDAPVVAHEIADRWGPKDPIQLHFRCEHLQRRGHG